MSETKAVWLEQYDWRSNKIYLRPCCPDCGEPIIYSGSKYVCMLCKEPVQVDDKMKEYISKVSEVKIDWQNCLKCGNKNCVETYYHRNPVTMEWETVHGKCVECGCRFIV